MKKIVLIPSYEPDNKLIELLKSIDKSFDIIVVNDGSSKETNSLFEDAKKYAHLISYETNMGKGYALKEGYKYIKDKYKEYVVVTMDSDGQHKIEDAKKLIDYIIDNKNDLAIGKRTWDKTTPIRSRIGNYLTRKIYKKATGKTIYDTQSGLRAFSNNLMDYMLNIKGNRYEYEMNVLLNLKDIKVHEIPIQTIYFNNNKGSHFKWFDDSKRVYKVIREYKKQS